MTFSSPGDAPPIDYLINTPEDLHLNGILETVPLTDPFSVGPSYTVDILSGKELTTFQAFLQLCLMHG